MTPGASSPATALPEHAAESRPLRRQRGTDRRTTTPPVLHPVPSTARIARARLAPVLCAGLWLLYVMTVVATIARGGIVTDAARLMATIVFVAAVSLLTLSACAYLIARAGALPRFAAHRRTRRVDLDATPGTSAPRIVALLPSRAEDPDLVRMSLWSVALQEAAHLRVVLLLDDDPDPTAPEDRASLAACRALAEELLTELLPIRQRVEAAAATIATGKMPQSDVDERVMREHAAAAQWLRAKADAAPERTHVEAFFRDAVLRRLADDLDSTAAALREAAECGAPALAPERAAQVMARLVNIFRVEATTFERKRYASLSHAPNKAMNLNSYIGLLGRRFRITGVDGGRHLTPVATTEAPAPEGEILEVPDADYVLTLDADSMLLPEYCLRLTHILEQPENARMAVAQTPYSAYRGAPTRLERLAGATTDLQHIVHQGLTPAGATFWVGANAILRRSALDDIRSETVEDGVRIVRFISDRTAIEDTESSLDLARRGWGLHNHPERLSYSATPPDFGSLAIQRRRWADGGLLILPRLGEVIARRRRDGDPMRWPELLLRLNYLGSVAWGTVGLLAVLLLSPLTGSLLTLLLVPIALPYFTEMASDLRQLGYRRRDVFGVYGLNLLLLAVNLSGTVGSLRQALTGARARFVRTPKVSTRTPAPALLVLAPLLLGAGTAWVAAQARSQQAWATVGFAGFTAVAVGWALLRLIGIRHVVGDLWFGWLNWLWVEQPDAALQHVPATPRWRAVLDDGPAEAWGAAR